MSDDELRANLAAVGTVAENVGKIMGLMRVVIAGLVACVLTCAGGAVWVNSTTEFARVTRDELIQVKAERTAQLEAWTQWRRSKDDIDVRTIVILEGIEKRLGQQQEQLNRLVQK